MSGYRIELKAVCHIEVAPLAQAVIDPADLDPAFPRWQSEWPSFALALMQLGSACGTEVAALLPTLLRLACRVRSSPRLPHENSPRERCISLTSTTGLLDMTMSVSASGWRNSTHSSASTSAMLSDEDVSQRHSARTAIRPPLHGVPGANSPALR